MKFAVSSAASGSFDTLIRVLNTETPICFGDPALQKAYQAVFPDDSLTLSHKQILPLRLPVEGRYVTVLLAGFDKEAPAGMDDLRSLFAALGTALMQHKAKTVLVDRLDALTIASEEEVLYQLASVLPLCEYRFETYLSQKSPQSNMAVTVLTDCGLDSLEEGHVLAESVMTARDLVNDLADVLTPEEMARRCCAYGAEYGFDVEVLDEAQCRKLGMNLFLSVAKGSALAPKFIVMRYFGGAEGQAPIAFVGKGITYDSGGLHIKTGDGMTSMRFDMNGAAAVIGAMCAISRRKLAKNVVAVVAACENAVDANSYRNGDVLTSMNGKTVFVQNTDAEGRLTMADAITYCVREEKPSEILEVAGLTGSVCNFFGTVCAAALTRTQAMFDRVAALMPITGEKYAQMPTFPAYAQLLKSPYADLNNAPAGGCGGILAGFFLDVFAEDVPFLHVDFGAMPFTSQKSDGQGAGGTGFGVKTLYHYVKNREN